MIICLYLYNIIYHIYKYIYIYMGDMVVFLLKSTGPQGKCNVNPGFMLTPPVDHLDVFVQKLCGKPSVIAWFAASIHHTHRGCSYVQTYYKSEDMLYSTGHLMHLMSHRVWGQLSTVSTYMIFQNDHVTFHWTNLSIQTEEKQSFRLLIRNLQKSWFIHPTKSIEISTVYL